MNAFTGNNELTIKEYVSGSTKASAQNTRLVPINFKTDKATGVKRDSICIEVAEITDNDIAANLSKLLPLIGASLHQLQAEQLRDISNEKKIGDVISAELFTIAGLISFSNSIATGNRMTKEFLEQWFKSELEDNLTLAIADKMGIGENPSSEQVKVVNETLEVYRSKLVSLSGSKSVLAIPVVDAMLKALSFVADKTDKTAARLVEKLEAMKAKPVADLFAL